MINDDVRLNAICDLTTLPVILFSFKYEEVVIDDGIIKSLKIRKPHKDGYVTNCGRIYYKIGKAFE